jgi:hypothetical protein
MKPKLHNIGKTEE